MTQAYPLHWPLGFPRTKSPTRSQFRTAYDGAYSNAMASLRAFAKDTGRDVTNVIVSSNITMMIESPKDGGVALYFRWDGLDCCIAVDRYGWPRENLQAIHHIIEAERVKLRHGGLNILRTSFRGYAALPPPRGPDGQLEKPWWSTLGFESADVPMEAVEARYIDLVKQHHPDRGGDAAMFNVVAGAIAAARKERSQS